MINLDSNIIAGGATTQYEDLDINGLAKFEGNHLVSTPTGLYKLSGDDDDGVVIDSYFKTAQMSFGLTNEKRLRFVYVTYEAAAAITLTISTEEGLSESYTIPASSSLQNVYRVTVHRSIYGSYWQFKFSGASFAIDEISVLPIVRRHKLT